MRELLSALARRPAVRKAAMSTPGLRNLAWRFVAGENLEAGIDVARSLQARGIRTTLNFVGTHVRDPAACATAADEAIRSLERLRDAGLEPNVSVKLTHLGLDVDEATCRLHLGRVLEAADRVGGFVRIDMEERPYVERTLSILDAARDRHRASVGVVLQSYLRRTRGDVGRLAAAGVPVRICKGGYWESSADALHDKGEIDRAFQDDVEFLIREGRRPAIASHDERIIADARRVAAEEGLGREAVEFQMLHGVRPDLQEALVRDGYPVRCYVPYGSRWYEYVLGCVRRLPGAMARRLVHRALPGQPT